MKRFAKPGPWIVLPAVMAFVGFHAEPARAAEPDAKGVQFFESKIRPVLVAQCYKCHSASASKLKGGLLLDSRAGARKGGETGPAVVPGSVDDSLLLSALRHEDLEMPPGKKLAAGVVADFETWIKMGAPDPRGGQVAVGGRREINIEQGRKFWAFQPPKKSAPPAVKNAAWPLGDVDRFVLAGMEAHAVRPVRDATPPELVRRVYFDLTGLPPSPEDVEKWVARLTARGNGNSASSPVNQRALAELIDALLASPRFGERWGRHWLDVARYADSNGNVDNTPFPHAWRYRNYVIDALNQDKPLDRFFTEQIAGDLLPYESARQRNEQLTATGFLALGSKPRAQNNPNFQMDVVAEQIEVTTSAMLGLTVGCARCHDHKFDPIPTAEYYSLAGIFTSSRTLYGTGGRRGKAQAPGGLIALLAEVADSDKAAQQAAQQRARLTERRRELASQLAKLGVDAAASPKAAKNKNNKNNKKRKAQVRKLQARLATLTAAGQNKKQIDRIQAQLAALGAGTDKVGSNPAGKNASAADLAAIKKLRGELARVEADLAELQGGGSRADGRAMGIAEGSPADCEICLRGESTDRGERVPRGFISVATSGQPPRIDAAQSGRRELAQWITSAENPLTARVAVNRIWQHLIGRGIVASADNFGLLGERPTHPELLDWLAVHLFENRWSVKRTIRTIMLSRSYQLASVHHEANHESDVDNTWLWRMRPRRLDAESFRDAILAFSGQLDLKRPAPAALAAGNRRQAPQVSSAGNHRSVYLPIVRNAEPEALTLFDFADPSIVVGLRQQTTVPTQSLYLMNSPFVVAQSQAAAQRVLALDAATVKDDAARVDHLYLLAYGRRPTDQQRQRATEYIERMVQAMAERGPSDQKRRLAAWATLCQSLIASAEFRYLD